VLLDRQEPGGTQIIGVNSLHLPPGAYIVRLRTGGNSLEQPLQIPAAP